MIHAPDRIVPGILLMIGFTVTAPVMDSFAKLAAADIPVGQIVAARFAVQIVLLFPVAAALGTLARPGAREAAQHLARAGLIVAATTAFFAALRSMPLADAIAIFFVEPFILTLLGALVLGESVGWRRVVACLVGFGGALMVIRPSFAAFGAVALLPLLTAFCFACYVVLTRHVARQSHPVALQAWTALAACVIVLPALVLFDGSGVAPLDPVMPQGVFWLWLLGVGLAATISHLFISAALRLAPTAVIAPLQYLEIVAAAALGYLIFDDLPDAQSFAGIAIIMGAGLYVFLRERHLSRPPPPPP
ncbi:DMT family transporter [Rhodovulum euryhalinum]|uniref:Threonine/homoserine efflux transporter RhtA n=1 Tax=Rhodovulum euryhalinum TaxID=35805 RepID=A0A4R2KD52_9RHOB|nr:DMT family transporter [Rhodovulum euryhalinum]TCO70854.1 threonine/homoserine efflux transporter RhtA [Rhodovulum euryhalinum]